MTALGEQRDQTAVMRTVILAIADPGLRERLRSSLTGLRWAVREAAGGAEAMVQMEASRPEALLIDNWLPDLEVEEFAGRVRGMYPGMEMLRVDGGIESGAARSPRRNELLHALREAQDALAPEVKSDGAAWAGAPVAIPQGGAMGRWAPPARGGRESAAGARVDWEAEEGPKRDPPAGVGAGAASLAEMVGVSPAMMELAGLIRMVAPHSATVLIEGETGTGKEVVAKALHRLSSRAGKTFTVLNCAAIPESLLEAELFGHTRGAFTGAVQSRTGRIEAAHGGTLFLDEIGEMPMALQAKMLRFLECGELQRVGDNETMRVDVRVIAATHQPLERRAGEGTFRMDLYHRLAVFPVEVPPLRDRMEDLPLLAEFFIARMGQDRPRKSLSAEALAKLGKHTWPGNVRELMHVLERGAILAGDRAEIGAEEIRLRRATKNSG